MDLFLVATLLLGFLAADVESDASDHRYKRGDSIPLYAKIGPFHNPSETYQYFDLPFCAPEHLNEETKTLGKVLNWNSLVETPFKLDFQVDLDSELLCKKNLAKEDVAKFRTAVAKDYCFQMYYDDLPIWGFIGKVVKEGNNLSEYKYYLYRHMEFHVLSNDDRVIEISVLSDFNSLVDLTEDMDIELDFIYSVRWQETITPYDKRMEKYLRTYDLAIHGFSILNSCMTVLLLTGFLAMILVRGLKNDWVVYNHDEESSEDQEETGWKRISEDVFRFPKNKSLLAACLGSGTQLLAIMICILILALVGIFNPYNRGATFTALAVIYALTCAIAGFTATSFYYQLEGTNWIQNLLLTGCLCWVPSFLMFCFLNMIAIVHNTTAALPFRTLIVILLICILSGSFFLVLGGIAGKNKKAEFQAPCRTRKIPREIPLVKWYRATIPQMTVAGSIPCSAIIVELYFILASIWGYRIYTSYGFLFIDFILLLVSTALVSVSLTYFQLSAEDHGWWWRSFLCGGSTGLFVFAYCLYYYFLRSDMSGFIQASFFFGYMACICYVIFLMLGVVGFRFALLFVRHIYGSIKCD